jgi:hypothetical protein
MILGYSAVSKLSSDVLSEGGRFLFSALGPSESQIESHLLQAVDIPRLLANTLGRSSLISAFLRVRPPESKKRVETRALRYYLLKQILGDDLRNQLQI